MRFRPRTSHFLQVISGHLFVDDMPLRFSSVSAFDNIGQHVRVQARGTSERTPRSPPRPTRTGARAMQRSTLAPARFDGISAARRQLVTTMQTLGFGRIEGLRIRDREPVFAPSPKIIREVKFGSDDSNSFRSEGDFYLKAQVVDLFREFDRLRDDTILLLEIKNGLPFKMAVGAAMA